MSRAKRVIRLLERLGQEMAVLCPIISVIRQPCAAQYMQLKAAGTSLGGNP